MHDLEQDLFEKLAESFPHEAAGVDWQKFMDYTRKKAKEQGKPEPSEAYVRECLNITEE